MSAFFGILLREVGVVGRGFGWRKRGFVERERN